MMYNVICQYGAMMGCGYDTLGLGIGYFGHGTAFVFCFSGSIRCHIAMSRNYFTLLSHACY